MKRVNNIYEFYIILHLSHAIDFHTWSKRYHNFYDEILWRDYFHSNIKFIYSKNDILVDSEYIVSKMNITDYIFCEKGKHGSCLFGKYSKNILPKIRDMLGSQSI